MLFDIHTVGTLYPWRYLNSDIHHSLQHPALCIPKVLLSLRKSKKMAMLAYFQFPTIATAPIRAAFSSLSLHMNRSRNSTISKPWMRRMTLPWIVGTITWCMRWSLTDSCLIRLKLVDVASSGILVATSKRNVISLFNSHQTLRRLQARMLRLLVEDRHISRTKKPSSLGVALHSGLCHSRNHQVNVMSIHPLRCHYSQTSSHFDNAISHW